jgi:eukaryotic-like serine/threonine-protein kinase
LAAAVVVAAVGWWSNRAVEDGLKEALRGQLQAILNADVAALRSWIQSQQAVAQTAAADPRVRALVERLTAEARSLTPPEILASPSLAELRVVLGHSVKHADYTEFLVVEPGGRTIAAVADEHVGTRSLADRQFLQAAFAGQTLVSPPFRAEVALPGNDGTRRAGLPTMFVAAPILDSKGAVGAALGFRIHPREFTRILQVGRIGETGETYAFGTDGTMLSLSRFEDSLRSIGLLSGDAESSILNLQIRDPGGDLTAGFVPTAGAAERPLTKMASYALSAGSGVDVNGYRDYRGVAVVGAWTFLKDMGVGVATEVDVSEAYASLTTVRRAFWSLIALCVLGAIGMFVHSGIEVGLRRRVALAERLGQYQLEEKIGEGGVGKVYRARHALLRRPTALKVLSSEDDDPEVLQRFEREVQFTARLTHPNTIAIYDYGHTPEGVFYYAMELLEGATLGRCVEISGAQPASRVIHLLAQACGSLAEAHRAGMIHRDVKPANLMICERGGMADFVKVLDFGLVRPVRQDQDLALTDTRAVTGTPLYLSPELIQAPDAVDVRSDLYQLGAVGYYLLTGSHVFAGANLYEVGAHHLYKKPDPPAERLGRPVAEDLSAVLLACLSKERDERPASAEELCSALLACADAHLWSQDDAQAWWSEWRSRLAAVRDVRTGTSGSRRHAIAIAVDSRDRSGSA